MAAGCLVVRATRKLLVCNPIQTAPLLLKLAYQKVYTVLSVIVYVDVYTVLSVVVYVCNCVCWCTVQTLCIGCKVLIGQYSTTETLGRGGHAQVHSV